MCALRFFKYILCSNILQGKYVKEIGMQLVRHVLMPLLKTGTIISFSDEMEPYAIPKRLSIVYTLLVSSLSINMGKRHGTQAL